MADKDSLTTLWVKYLGTASFNEYAYSLTVTPDGSIFALGQISANGFTNGNNDLLLMSLSVASGQTRFVQNLGASIADNPGGIIYNSINEKVNIFGNTNSIAFKNQGGLDWFILQIDKRGRNQCTAINLVNQTDILKFRASSTKVS